MFPNLSTGAIGIRTDFAGALALAKTHAWVGCDVPMVEAAQLATERSASDVAALFTESGVKPGGWGLTLPWHSSYDSTALATLKTHAALAAQIGCTRVTTVVMPRSDERPFRENFAFHVAQLRPIAQVLAEHGCQLGLEFIGPRTLRDNQRYGFLYSLEGVLSLAQAIGPNVGLLLDCWHWYTSLGTLADIRTLRAEDVVYVHVNDAPANVAIEAQIDNVRRLPGTTGVIDIAGFLQTLREIGYTGPVTPEPFEKRLSSLPADETCQLARDSMRQIWQALD